MRKNIFNLVKWIMSMIGLFLTFIGITFLANGEYKIQFIFSLTIGILISYISIRKLIKSYNSDLILLKAGLYLLLISGVSYLILILNVLAPQASPPMNSVIAPWYITALFIISYSFVFLGVFLVLVFFLKRIYSFFRKNKNQ
jgi:hypothetical protein